MSFIILMIFSSGKEKINQQLDDYVPNEDTAKKIAEAIWIPIYGEKVKNFKPYKAYLVDDDTIWVVQGVLPKGRLGGTPYIEINKKDCRVLKVSHGK